MKRGSLKSLKLNIHWALAQSTDVEMLSMMWGIKGFGFQISKVVIKTSIGEKG
jgi:hypothetical protein